MKYVLLVLILALPLASADQFYTSQQVSDMRWEAQQILEHGSYYELREFREQTGVNWFGEITNFFDFSREQISVREEWDEYHPLYLVSPHRYHSYHQLLMPITICSRTSCVSYYR